jgi:hypothetical protein
MSARILVVDDEANIRALIEEIRLEGLLPIYFLVAPILPKGNWILLLGMQTGWIPVLHISPQNTFEQYPALADEHGLFAVDFWNPVRR